MSSEAEGAICTQSPTQDSAVRPLASSSSSSSFYTCASRLSSPAEEGAEGCVRGTPSPDPDWRRPDLHMWGREGIWTHP